MKQPLPILVSSPSLLSVAGALMLALGVLPCPATDTAPAVQGSANSVGLQLYSLRDQFKQDVPGTLDKVRAFSFRNVELAGTYGLPAETFRAMLDERGLKPIAAHFGYERYRDDVDGIAAEAKALGVDYVGCAWIPMRPFDEKACREAIAVFNQAGEALARHNLKFYYHIHGYEFAPFANGTLFDLMAKETNPDWVRFQMDIFWAVHAGQDPVKLFEAHGSRWELTHLKDMRRGTPTGLFTGQSDLTNDVPLGKGVIDYVAVLRAAQKAGVKWHFIEDESPTVEQQIPVSLTYLKNVSW
jgi:sugar phosphate isomerase/epimerase